MKIRLNVSAVRKQSIQAVNLLNNCKRPRDARGKAIEYLNSHRNLCLLWLNPLTLSMTKTGRDNRDIYWANRQERANYNGVNHVHRTLVPGFDSADHVIQLQFSHHNIGF